MGDSSAQLDDEAPRGPNPPSALKRKSRMVPLPSDADDARKSFPNLAKKKQSFAAPVVGGKKTLTSDMDMKKKSMPKLKMKKSGVRIPDALSSSMLRPSTSETEEQETSSEVRLSYKKSTKAVPGSAGAHIAQTVATGSTPVTFRSTHVGGARPAPLLLPPNLASMSPSLVETEIEKQNQALNRMAAQRHTAQVQAHLETSSDAHVDHVAGHTPGHEHGPHLITIEGTHTAAQARQTLAEKKSTYSTVLVDHAPSRPSQLDMEEEQQESLEETSSKLTMGRSTSLHHKSRFHLEGEESNVQARHFGDWDLISTVKANELHEVKKYRSATTGLTLCHVRIESPEVVGFLAFRHKVENDLGLPHILAHLVFLGSAKNYPTPGVLEKLSIKCFSKGVDAWTESDHAAYTLTTAGKEGFLAILPVFLEHLFFPSLSEAGYITEAHHVNGQGVDGGLVYLEMKEFGQDPSEIATWALTSLVYPEESGYRHNWGGDHVQMRENCGLSTVVDFHDKFYSPDNACLIVCGDVTVEEVFGTLNNFLSDFSTDLEALGRVENPWKGEALLELSPGLVTRIDYPSEEEDDNSIVKIGIIGAPCINDVSYPIAVDILMLYLAHGSVSPVHKAVTETFGPEASVHLTQANHIQTLYSFTFQGVPTESVEEVPGVLRSVLQRQTGESAEEEEEDEEEEGEEGDEFDAERMEAMVLFYTKSINAGLESEPELSLAKSLIADFLFNFEDDQFSFDRRVNLTYTVEQFRGQPPTFWKDMMRFILQANWAVVYASPSTSLWEEKEASEAKRVEDRVETLGRPGLKKLGARLKAAMKIKATPPPQDVLDPFTIPSTASIGYLAIERMDNPEWASDTLCNLYFDNINSNYVHLTVLMDTSELEEEERRLLLLFGASILEAPFLDEAEVFQGYEHLVAGLGQNVLKVQTALGIELPKEEEEEGSHHSHGSWGTETRYQESARFFCGAYSHLFCIQFQIEVGKVRKGFTWMETLLWNTKWQSDRLKAVAQRLSREAKAAQNPASITRAMHLDSLYASNSNVKSLSLVRQSVLLEKIGHDLPNSFKKVARVLEGIRMVCLRPENMTIHVSAHMEKMEFYLTDKPEVSDAVGQLLRSTFDYTGWHWGYPTKRLANEGDAKWMKGEDCIKACVSEKIMRMPGTKVAYLIQSAPCVKEYSSPELPTVLTTLAYFSQPDGPFTKAIKAPGHAPYFSLYLKPEEGLVYFEIKGASDLVSAYVGVYNLLLAHLQEEETPKGKKSVPIWSSNLLDSAKSSAIFALVELENTPKVLTISALLERYRQVGANYNRVIMKRIAGVTLEEVKAMTKKYLEPLLVQATTCSVSAPEEKVHSIIEAFSKQCGKRFVLMPPVHLSDLASF